MENYREGVGRLCIYINVQNRSLWTWQYFTSKTANVRKKDITQHPIA